MPDSGDLLSQLRATLGKMEIALGAISDAIVWTDEQGVIQWCNAAFDRLVGRSHLEALGAQLTRVLPLSQQGRPVSADAYPVRRVLQVSAIASETYEFRVADHQRMVEISAALARTGAQELSVVLLLRDITERRRTEELLQGKMRELEGLNRIMMGREERVLELKEQVKALQTQLAATSSPAAP